MLSDFTIYDPRFQERIFRLNDGRTWSSKEAGVLVFETEIYGHYTDSEFIEELLDALISESAAEDLGLKITGNRPRLLPPWLERAETSDDELRSTSEGYQINRVAQFFNQYADYQKWNFYGLMADFRDLTKFTSLPDVLNYTSTFPFFVEVDLDGMLLGYISPNRELDSLVARLSLVRR